MEVLGNNKAWLWEQNTPPRTQQLLPCWVSSASHPGEGGLGYSPQLARPAGEVDSEQGLMSARRAMQMQTRGKAYNSGFREAGSAAFLDNI